MSERPILFSAPMVRAILDGWKTQTRRVVKLRRGVSFENAIVTTWDEEAERLRVMAPEPPDIAPFLLGKRIEGQQLVCNLIDDVGIDRVHCPYGQPGDRLWVRETHLHIPATAAEDFDEIMYADHEDYDGCYPDKKSKLDLGWRVRSAIHMPRWASRITLEITDVRVERVSEITRADVDAEGLTPGWDWKGAYRTLWDALNAKRGYGWDVNPWVWVLTFRSVADHTESNK